MILATIGDRWSAVQTIYRTVGNGRFKCSDINYPDLRGFLQDLVYAGVLVKYRYAKKDGTNEYQLPERAIHKIERYGGI